MLMAMTWSMPLDACFRSLTSLPATFSCPSACTSRSSNEQISNPIDLLRCVCVIWCAACLSQLGPGIPLVHRLGISAYHQRGCGLQAVGHRTTAPSLVGGLL